MADNNISFSKLERELLSAWAAEVTLPDDAADDEADAVQEQTTAIIEKIVAVPAMSIRDLRIKARAAMILHDNELDFGPQLDGRIASSIIRDLLSIDV